MANVVNKAFLTDEKIFEPMVSPCAKKRFRKISFFPKAHPARGTWAGRSNYGLLEDVNVTLGIFSNEAAEGGVLLAPGAVSINGAFVRQERRVRARNARPETAGLHAVTIHGDGRHEIS